MEILTYKYDFRAHYGLGAGLGIGHPIYCIRSHCNETLGVEAVLCGRLDLVATLCGQPDLLPALCG